MASLLVGIVGILMAAPTHDPTSVLQLQEVGGTHLQQAVADHSNSDEATALMHLLKSDTTSALWFSLPGLGGGAANYAGLQFDIWDPLRSLLRLQPSLEKLPDEKPFKLKPTDWEFAWESDDPCKNHWNQKVLQELTASNKTVFIAGLLHQNGDILPAYARELMRLILAIGRDRVFVSLYESGSIDSTVTQVTILRDELENLQIPHRIISANDSRTAFEESHLVWQHTSRIAFLAHLRNHALSPMLDLSTKFDRVLFLNDILFCAQDAALLLMDPSGSHMVSGVDVEGEKDSVTFNFYDTWVTRDITGAIANLEDNQSTSGRLHIMRHPPFFEHEPSQRRVREGVPVPVQCTWNGMVSIRGDLFWKHALLFRTNDAFECSASECSLFCNDVWRIFGSETRILIDPRVVVAYEPRIWSEVWMIRAAKSNFCTERPSFCKDWFDFLKSPYVGNSSSAVEHDNGSDSFPLISPPESVVCVPLSSGNYADFKNWHDDSAWNLRRARDGSKSWACPLFEAIQDQRVESDLVSTDNEQRVYDAFTVNDNIAVVFGISIPENLDDAMAMSEQLAELFIVHSIGNQWPKIELSIIQERSSSASNDSTTHEATRDSGPTVRSIALNVASSLVGTRYRHTPVDHSVSDVEALRLHVSNVRATTDGSKAPDVILMVVRTPFCATDMYRMIAAMGRTTSPAAEGAGGHGYVIKFPSVWASDNMSGIEALVPPSASNR